MCGKCIGTPHSNLFSSVMTSHSNLFSSVMPLRARLRLQRGQYDRSEEPVIYMYFRPELAEDPNVAPETFRAAVRLEGSFSNRDTICN